MTSQGVIINRFLHSIGPFVKSQTRRPDEGHMKVILKVQLVACLWNVTLVKFSYTVKTFLVNSFSDRSNPVGNLLVIAFVSYFGAKLHRPKIIALGCLLMSFGTFLIATPHFVIGR